MKKIEIYSKQGCQPCRFVKDHLNRELQSEIEDDTVELKVYDVTEDEEALERLLNMGFQGVPVTVSEGFDPIHGLAIDKLNHIVYSFKS